MPAECRNSPRLNRDIMPVAVVRTAWAGTSGGPGVTQTFIAKGNLFAELTASDAQAAVNAVRAFFASAAQYLPDEIQLTTSPVVDQYDIPSGDLISSVSAPTPPALVAGTSTAAYFMATGMKVNLNTTTIRNGRRVRGGIYLVPASSAVMGLTGNVLPGARTTINTAGNTLMNALTTAGLQLTVYSRPLTADQPKGPRGGNVATVTAIETNEKGAILRGRRD